jgi:hypothetical protein
MVNADLLDGGIVEVKARELPGDGTMPPASALMYALPPAVLETTVPSALAPTAGKGRDRPRNGPRSSVKRDGGGWLQ